MLVVVLGLVFELGVGDSEGEGEWVELLVDLVLGLGVWLDFG